MLVLGLDAATRTGFCIGESGGKPRVGSTRLKKGDEPVQVAWANIGHFLRDMFRLDRPELIAIEAPMHPAAQRSPDAVVLQWGLVAVVTFLADAYEIRLEYVNAQTVSKHFTGKARWKPEEGGREAKKAAAVARARLLGYMDKDGPADHDAADAVAVWDFAVHRWSKPAVKSLHLFGERP